MAEGYFHRPVTSLPHKDICCGIGTSPRLWNRAPRYRETVISFSAADHGSLIDRGALSVGQRPGRRDRWGLALLAAVLVVGTCLPAACGTSPEARNQWVRTSLEATFTTDDRGVYRRLLSILISVNDQVVVEQYRQNHPADQTLEIQSITKSVLSMLTACRTLVNATCGADVPDFQI